MKTDLELNINESSEKAPAKRSTIQNASLTCNLMYGIYFGGLSVLQLTALGTLLVTDTLATPTEKLLAAAVLAESTYFGRFAFLSFREAFKKIAALENTITANGLTTHGVFSASRAVDTRVTTAPSMSGMKAN
jgi:hypothetical protein